MKIKTSIIASLIIIAILGAVSIFVLLNRTTDPEFTGGSGEPEKGYLVLRGYETKSNSNNKMSLGVYFTTTQQRAIRSFLEVQLFKIKQNKEYFGDVIPGSVDVNYRTNVVQFKVQIEDPEIIYTVQYNPVTDDMTVIDEDGNTYVAPKQAP